ncbi:MAG: ABC transporter permease [Geminicoccaceae bacterium]|jgi:sulfonate transport system permease protein|nr:MAG: ABC transporter permease [Geminicoccaceae bacterium]
MATAIERLGRPAEPAARATPEGSPARTPRVPPALLGLVLPVGVALAWELAAAQGWIARRLLPPPSTILVQLQELAASGELLRHLEATLRRVVLGFALGVTVATLLGAVTGTFDLLRRLLDPTLQALRAIPSIAWVPLFVLWFGIFETPKVLLIAVGAFFPVYLGLEAGIRGVDRKLVEVGRVYHLGPLAMIGRILLPAALPAWLTGVRGGLGLAWMFVIAAELMGASEGLGYLLMDGQMSGNAAVILGALLLFAVLGKASDALLVLATRRLVAWQDGFKSGG